MIATKVPVSSFPLLSTHLPSACSSESMVTLPRSSSFQVQVPSMYFSQTSCGSSAIVKCGRDPATKTVVMKQRHDFNMAILQISSQDKNVKIIITEIPVVTGHCEKTRQNVSQKLDIPVHYL